MHVQQAQILRAREWIEVTKGGEQGVTPRHRENMRAMEADLARLIKQRDALK
jgi:F0F1-type ATP synthase epsilon subunit